MIFASEYDTAGLKPPWKNKTLLSTPTDRTNHTMSYFIEDLEPDTQYEARVFSKNKFGWSESSEPFRFRTRLSGWLPRFFNILGLICVTGEKVLRV